MRISDWSSDVCSSDLFGLYEIGIGQFVGVAHPVYQDDFLETIVDVRILDDAHERSKAGSGGEKIKIPARFQIVDQQGTHRLAADQNRIPRFQMLQARSQGAVLYLDAEKLEVFLVVRTRDAIGAHQRFAIDLEAKHDKMAVMKPQ